MSEEEPALSLGGRPLGVFPGDNGAFVSALAACASVVRKGWCLSVLWESRKHFQGTDIGCLSVHKSIGALQ